MILPKLAACYVLFFSLFFITHNAVAESVGNPCSDESLLGLTDRGSVSNTPCVLAPKVMILETGYQYRQYTQDISQQNYPQTTFFMGLPMDSELFVAIPSFIQQSSVPASGVTATSFGIKHKLSDGAGWVTSVDLVITPAGGSANFGYHNTGIILNGIVSYSVDPKTSLTFMMGGGTITDPYLVGGRRFNSVDPSLVLSYAPSEKLSAFIEVFAQTKTSADSGANYNADCGILYLLTPNVALDVEVAQQLGHEVASFNQFYGSGVTVKF